MTKKEIRKWYKKRKKELIDTLAYNGDSDRMVVKPFLWSTIILLPIIMVIGIACIATNAFSDATLNFDLQSPLVMVFIILIWIYIIFNILISIPYGIKTRKEVAEIYEQLRKEREELIKNSKIENK